MVLINNTTIIIGIVGIVLFVLWAIKLYDLSQSRKSSGKKYFYLLFLIPIIVGIIATLFFYKEYILVMSLIKSIVLISALILYIGFWAVSLYKAGGKDSLVWFILLFIPSIWILYLATEE